MLPSGPVTVTADPSDLLVIPVLLQGNLVTVWLWEGTANVTYTVSVTAVSEAGTTVTRAVRSMWWISNVGRRRYVG
jgi:hypothetical protein